MLVFKVKHCGVKRNQSIKIDESYNVIRKIQLFFLKWPLLKFISVVNYAPHQNSGA